MVTMMRVYELFHEVQDELKDLVPYRSISPTVYTTNSKRSLGRCRAFSLQNGMFMIYISKYLLECSEELIKNVLAHEIIHTVSGCFNHGYRFQYYVNLVNYKLGYNIGVKYKDDEFNPPYKYKITCLKCGAVFYRYRVGKGKYRHGLCKGELKIEKIA